MHQAIHPIVLPKEEWDRIVHWTDENKEDPETIRRRKYVKYLNETSSEMTKTWPNSLQNVNKRNEEMRRARLEAAESANSRFYKRYIQKQREKQQQMLYSARDTIFKNKDAPKLLLSAVIESVVLKEREEQLKFNAKYLGKYRDEQKKLNDEMIINKAKEWNDMQEEKKRRRFEINKQHQKELVDQAHELAERKRKEYEEELNMQRLDIINSNKEREAIKAFQRKYKENEKARIWADNDRSMKETEKRRSEAAARDKMDDKLIEVLMKSRARTEARRRATEKHIRDEKLRVLEEISKKLESGDASRDAREQASLEKAVKERDAAVERRHQKLLAKQAQFKQERVSARAQWLAQQAQRQHEEHTAAQWGLMNRFKNQEIYEDFKENLRKEEERKKLEFKDSINKQRKEREERERRELAERRYFYGELAETKLRDEDNKLLTHAAALLDEAVQHGRPTLPIHKAIDRYCKMYRLYPMPELPASLQRHFPQYSPRDGSRPDAGYSAELKPQRQKYVEDDAAPQDGLRDMIKARPSKSGRKNVPPPEKVDDYKRQGPANGLQLKPVPEEIRLPTINTIPCTTKECICDLKQ